MKARETAIGAGADFIARGTLGVLVSATFATLSCGGAEAVRATEGCIPIARTADSAALVVDRVLRVDAPCTVRAHAHIRGPIELTATQQGLRIVMDVDDDRYRPGAYRQARGERDVVVVFPTGEASGAGFHELATVPRGLVGYRVDDEVSWDAWGLDGPRGSFHLQLVVFERDAVGNEHQVRVAMHLRVRDTP